MSYPWQSNRFTGVDGPWNQRLSARSGYDLRTSLEVEDLYQAFKERLIAELRADDTFAKGDVTHECRKLLPLVEVELEVET